MAAQAHNTSSHAKVDVLGAVEYCIRDLQYKPQRPGADSGLLHDYRVAALKLASGCLCRIFRISMRFREARNRISIAAASCADASPSMFLITTCGDGAQAKAHSKQLNEAEGPTSLRHCEHSTAASENSPSCGGAAGMVAVRKSLGKHTKYDDSLQNG